MVDPIGPKGMSPTDFRVAPVAAATPVVRVAPVPDPSPNSAVGQMTGQLAAQPPVDADRVAKIKRAIAEGNFPILPATIADRMIALRYDWMSNDPA